MKHKLQHALSIVSNNKRFSIIFFITTLVSFLFFNYKFDLFLTSWQSDDLLTNLFEGHFLNYYTYIIEVANTGKYSVLNHDPAACYANYGILTYLILAIWILPLRIICSIFSLKYSYFALTMWCKILFFIVELLTASKLYNISEMLFEDSKKSKFITELYLSSVIVNYAIFLFGQYDILYVYVALIAVELYLKDKLNAFSLLMGIAICLKGFAIFACVPMLLIKEKKIPRLLKYMAEIAVPYLIWQEAFGRHYGYRMTKEAMSGNYGFIDRLFEIKIFGDISVFVLFAIVICILCYYIKWSDTTRRYFYLPALALLLSFNLFVSNNHPQWWMMTIPFLCIAVGQIKDSCIASLLYAGASTSYLMYYCFWGTYNVDNIMIGNGILKLFYGDRPRNIHVLSDLLSKINLSLSITHSLLFAFLLMILAIAIYESVKNREHIDSYVLDSAQSELFKNHLGVLLQFLVTWGFIGMSFVEYFWGFRG